MDFIYEIYIDSLFLMNFLMDLLVLYLTGIFLRRHMKAIRLIGSAALAGILGIVLFLFSPGYICYLLVTHCCLNPLMIWMAYGGKRIAQVIKNWLVSYLFMFLAGGIMQWINRSVFHGTHVLSSILITACLGVAAAIMWERHHMVQKNLYPVTLRLKGQSVVLEALYDTGNLMVDPYVKRPVSIVNRETVKEILSKNPAIRLIPFSSMGQENGWLEAITVDALEVKTGRQTVYINAAVIGLAACSIFQNKEYQMILNSRLL